VGTGAKLDNQYTYPAAKKSPQKWSYQSADYTPAMRTVGMYGSHQYDPHKVGPYLDGAQQTYDEAIQAGKSPQAAQRAATEYIAASSMNDWNAQQQAKLDAANQQQQGNAAKNAMDALLKQYNRNPYENLLNQLLVNTKNAQQQGADALSQLKAELGQQANPYSNLKFSTPTAVTNPLAQYMGATGASTAQTDALTNFLGALSQNAVQADQERSKALGASWENLQGQRLADANTSQASFTQQLAQQLAQQQGNLEAQRQKYQNDLYQQMVNLAMKYGMQMPAGVK
jgi:hypothetical protein